ncbi:MAG: PAS domain-containing protein [Nitrospirales bacterium]|nr:PAS domain-containing protein [Nitrospira sp.]MDR4501457.1 PAS domain-containing protein [Nitrospirales bacterium]
MERTLTSLTLWLGVGWNGIKSWIGPPAFHDAALHRNASILYAFTIFSLCQVVYQFFGPDPFSTPSTAIMVFLLFVSLVLLHRGRTTIVFLLHVSSFTITLLLLIKHGLDDRILTFPAVMNYVVLTFLLYGMPAAVGVGVTISSLLGIQYLLVPSAQLVSVSYPLDLLARSMATQLFQTWLMVALFVRWGESVPQHFSLKVEGWWNWCVLQLPAWVRAGTQAVGNILKAPEFPDDERSCQAQKLHPLLLCGIGSYLIGTILGLRIEPTYLMGEALLSALYLGIHGVCLMWVFQGHGRSATRMFCGMWYVIVILVAYEYGEFHPLALASWFTAMLVFVLVLDASPGIGLGVSLLAVLGAMSIIDIQVLQWREYPARAYPIGIILLTTLAMSLVVMGTFQRTHLRFQKQRHAMLTMYQKIIDESPIGIVLFSAEGNILSANPSAYAMIGIELDDMKALACRLHAIPELHMYRHCWQNQQPTASFTTTLDSSEENPSVALKLDGTVLLNEHGKVMGCHVMLVDLSQFNEQKKQLEEAIASRTKINGLLHDRILEELSAHQVLLRQMAKLLEESSSDMVSWLLPDCLRNVEKIMGNIRECVQEVSQNPGDSWAKSRIKAKEPSSPSRKSPVQETQGDGAHRDTMMKRRKGWIERLRRLAFPPTFTTENDRIVAARLHPLLLVFLGQALGALAWVSAVDPHLWDWGMRVSLMAVGAAVGLLWLEHQKALSLVIIGYSLWSGLLIVGVAVLFGGLHPLTWLVAVSSLFGLAAVTTIARGLLLAGLILTFLLGIIWAQSSRYSPLIVHVQSSHAFLIVTAMVLQILTVFMGFYRTMQRASLRRQSTVVNYREMLDKAPVGIVVRTLQGEVQSINQAALQILEVDQPENPHACLAALRRIPGLSDQLAQCLSTGRVPAYETRLPVNPWGLERTIQVHCSLLADHASQSIGYLLMLVDTSQLTLQAQQLAEHFRKQEQLAEKLHDSILQNLYVHGLCLESVARDLKRHPVQAQASLDKMLEEVNQIMWDVRMSMAGKESSNLRGLNWLETFQNFSRALEETGTIQTHIDCSQTLLELVATHQEDHLEHILREGLSNAVRHGQASRVWIRTNLDEEHGMLQVDVVDNGCGFDLSRRRLQPGLTGHGLKNLQTRVKEMDGQLVILSQPGHGTVLQIRIPCEASLKPKADGVTSEASSWS